MELYIFCGAVRDREMTSWYFPARVERRGFRWNVTMFKARGTSITFQFSGSVYSPSLFLLDQRKSELDNSEESLLPLACSSIKAISNNTLMDERHLF